MTGASPAPSNAPLTGKAAIVTGGTRGIGFAIATRLLLEGAHVVVTALDERNGRSAAARLSSIAHAGQEVAFVAADAANRSVMATAFAAAQDLGQLSVCVLNAGIGDAAPLAATDDKFWHRLHHGNLDSAFIGITLAAEAMKSSGGAIVAIASTNAFWMESNLAAYNASKAAIVALIRTAAMEFAEFGITVNAVAPGSIATRMTEGMMNDPKLSDEYLSRIPLKRFGTPEDVAGAVSYLVSRDAEWVTGSVLVVDGGQTLGSPYPLP